MIVSWPRSPGGRSHDDLMAPIPPRAADHVDSSAWSCVPLPIEVFRFTGEVWLVQPEAWLTNRPSRGAEWVQLRGAHTLL